MFQQRLFLFFFAFISIGVNLVGFEYWAHAEDMRCQSKGVVRCPCPASMSVSCPSGKEGYIDNAEKVKSIKFKYRSKSGDTKEIVIQNPKLGVRDYYAAQYNDEVKAELKRLGVDLEKGGQIFLDSFEVNTNVTLYSDPNKKQVLGASETQAVSKCQYVAPPLVMKAEGCADAICVGTVDCNGFRVIAGCAPKIKFTKVCPTADACVADDKVGVMDADVIRYEGLPVPKGGSSASDVK